MRVLGLIHGVFTATFSLLPSYVLSSGYMASDMSYVYGLSMLIAALLIVVMMRLLMKEKSRKENLSYGFNHDVLDWHC